ncbi:hypothetical protein ACG02S_16590 [Roseateles sp. DC23W]|uniref:Outer membrane protein beta-barrel domain-containing protein n=1 Tax=Pelomonas dachongensis TaxID=3299029 RepID=A0ABW7EPT7_9BURK
MTRLARAAVLSLSALLTTATALAADVDMQPRWQARLQLSSTDGTADTRLQLGSSRVLSANLLGDYYLTRSGLSGLSGGLRATGGLLTGPVSLSHSSGGLALGNGPVTAGQRHVSVSGMNPYTLEHSASLSYLGIGYTGRVTSGGLAFSADLGLMSGSVGGLRLGRSADQGFEDAMRDLRFKPLLQLGLAYSY